MNRLMKRQHILVLMFQNSLILETPIAQLGRGCPIILQKKSSLVRLTYSEIKSYQLTFYDKVIEVFRRKWLASGYGVS